MKQQEQQPQSRIIYIKGTNTTDWEMSEVLCLEISPAAVAEMWRIQQTLIKKFSEYQFGVSLNLYLKGVSGYFCRLVDEDEEDYEFDTTYITEIPEGFEEDKQWDIRLTTTSIYKDEFITFNGDMNHGSGDYYATINLDDLESIFT